MNRFTKEVSKLSATAEDRSESFDTRLKALADLYHIWRFDSPIQAWIVERVVKLAEAEHNRVGTP